MKLSLRQIFGLPKINLTLRDHLIAILLCLSVLPVFRGGRDPLGILFISTCLLLILILLNYQPKKKMVELPDIIKYPLIAFIGLNFLSLIWTADFYAGLLKSILWFQAILFGYICLIVLSKKQFRKLILRYLSLSGMLTAIIAIGMYLTIPFDRASGLFYWPNPLSLYMFITLFISVWRYIGTKSNFYFFNSALISIVFVMTGSLAMFVFAFLLTLIFIYFKRDKIKEYLFTYLALIIYSLIVFAGINYAKTNWYDELSIGTPDQFSDLIDLKSSGISDRFNYWQSSWDLIKEEPIFGNGTGSFQILYPTVQKDVGSAVTNPHNLYIHTLFELGVLGFVLLLITIAYVLIRNLNPAKLEKNIAYFVICLAWLMHAGFYQTDRYPVLILLFILFMCMLIWQSDFKSKAVEKWQIPTAIILSVSLVIVSFFIFNSRTISGEANRSAAEFSVGRSIRFFKQAINTPIYDPDNIASLAWQNYLIGDYETAYFYIDQAIEQDPFDSNHYFVKGFVLSRDEKKNQAFSYIKAAIERDPINYPRYYIVYSDLLIAQGKYEQAGIGLDNILSQYTDEAIKRRTGNPKLPLDVAQLHFQKARVHYEAGEYKKALNQLNRALELSPNHEPSKRFIILINDRM